MNCPLITILSPVYNVEPFLSQCLESIIHQTYINLQVVLIDDGSKDGSWRIMQEYAAKDSRIEIYHQENQGVATTRNHLLDKIKGDYVLFVDSDDWIEPNMVEFLVEKAVKYEADIIICGMVTNDVMVRVDYSEKVYNKETTIKEFLFHNELRGSLWNKLVKTNLLQNLSFHCGISYGEDALFCWHFFQNAKKVIMTDKLLYHYRMNENSISHQTFGEKKLTGHQTWTIITEETLKWWPQYLPISQARWALEDMYLLRDASQGGFPKDEYIKELQITVKKYLSRIKASRLIDKKDIFYAQIISHWYGFGKLYYVLHRLKRFL